MLAGVALLLAFPPYGWWPLAPVGVALLAAAAHRRRLRAGAGLGILTGVALFAPLLEWTNLHTGYAAVGAAVAAAGRLSGAARRRHRLGVAAAATGTRCGVAAGHRGAVGGAGGAAGPHPVRRVPVGAARVQPGHVAAAAARGARRRAAGHVRGRRSPVGCWSPPRGGAPAAPGPVAAGGRGRRWSPLALVCSCSPPVGRADRGARPRAHRDVAVVQGNVPRLGLDFNAQRRAVLDNHVEATSSSAGRVAAGRARRPDLVVWPENSSDIDPLRNADAAARDRAAPPTRSACRSWSAPCSPDPAPARSRNAGLVWEPGRPGRPGRCTSKRHPVPFAEYDAAAVDIARMVSDEVDRVRSDFVAGRHARACCGSGRRPSATSSASRSPTTALVRDTVTGGAQLLVVQTNNATFDEAEARQQLAMVAAARRRTRPGRADGVHRRDLRVRRRRRRRPACDRFNDAAVIVAEMRLGAARTLATRLGAGPRWR